MSFYSAEFQRKAEAFLPVWRAHSGLSPSGSYLDLSMGSGPVMLLSSLKKRTLSEIWKAKALCAAAVSWGNVSISVFFSCFFFFLLLMIQINLSCSWSQLWVCLFVTTICVRWQPEDILVMDSQLTTKCFCSIFTVTSMLIYQSYFVCLLHLSAFSGVRLLWQYILKKHPLFTSVSCYCLLIAPNLCQKLFSNLLEKRVLFVNHQFSPNSSSN